MKRDSIPAERSSCVWHHSAPGCARKGWQASHRKVFSIEGIRTVAFERQGAAEGIESKLRPGIIQACQTPCAGIGSPLSGASLGVQFLVRYGRVDGWFTKGQTAMAGGWTRDGAVQDQIDASVRDAIDQVRRRIPTGSSLTHCEECGQAIPQARREAVPGVRHCVPCQQQIDSEQQPSGLYNRRGSKDSQLR